MHEIMRKSLVSMVMLIRFLGVDIILVCVFSILLNARRLIHRGFLLDHRIFLRG